MQGALNLEENFKKNLFKIKSALDWTVEYAIANGISPETFAFVPKIWEDNAFLIVKKAEEKIFVSQKTAEIFVPVSQIENLHDLLHESIHRLVILQMNVFENVLFPQIAETFDLQLVFRDRNNLEPNSFDIVMPGPEEYETAKKHLLDVYEFFIEGITEWVAQFTNTVSREHGYPLFSDINEKYSRQVEAQERLKELLLAKDVSERKADAILIKTALTADAIDIKKILKGDFLKYLNLLKP